MSRLDEKNSFIENSTRQDNEHRLFAILNVQNMAYIDYLCKKFRFFFEKWYCLFFGSSIKIVMKPTVSIFRRKHFVRNSFLRNVFITTSAQIHKQGHVIDGFSVRYNCGYFKMANYSFSVNYTSNDIFLLDAN
jgi:hypothetical protein